MRLPLASIIKIDFSVGNLVFLSDLKPDSFDWKSDLDHDGFCATVRDRGRALRVADDRDGWRCGGFVDGVWSPIILDFEALCVWQFGESAVPRQDEPDGGAFSTVCITPT